ncbi:hypothetical protein VCUG_02425 [Vavraia culicis subsp. floridensis]|uniref:C2H2-type domain-containing protein n=1 Tax=Vavraia culicis (isolate floridensis) TaxID=948595 RepID=L2GSM3_VAVCU|nr:uncharacterized protein VCUG_02425 [Vavraia culicis subsp. floridensis]ELA46090.1 hypothetical protein VCUG_02425 [Vavraia culicis subsp. floridensis]
MVSRRGRKKKMWNNGSCVTYAVRKEHAEDENRHGPDKKFRDKWYRRSDAVARYAERYKGGYSAYYGCYNYDNDMRCDCARGSGESARGKGCGSKYVVADRTIRNDTINYEDADKNRFMSRNGCETGYMAHSPFENGKEFNHRKRSGHVGREGACSDYERYGLYEEEDRPDRGTLDMYHERCSDKGDIAEKGSPYREQCPSNEQYYLRGKDSLHRNVENGSPTYRSTERSFSKEEPHGAGYRIGEQRPCNTKDHVTNSYECACRNHSYEVDGRPSENHSTSYYCEDADSLGSNDFRTQSENVHGRVLSARSNRDSLYPARSREPSSSSTYTRTPRSTAKSGGHSSRGKETLYRYLNDDTPKFSVNNELYKTREEMGDSVAHTEGDCDPCQNRRSDHGNSVDRVHGAGYMGRARCASDLSHSEEYDGMRNGEYESYRGVHTGEDSFLEYSSLSKDPYHSSPFSMDQVMAVCSGAFQCIRCKFYFKRLSTLKIHMISHLKRANFFNCTRCNLAYKSCSLVKKHCLKEHNEIVLDVKYSELRIFVAFLSIFREFYNPFVDSFCLNCFTYPKSLNLHPCKGRYAKEKTCMLCGDSTDSVRKHILGGVCQWRVEYEFK